MKAEDRQTGKSCLSGRTPEFYAAFFEITSLQIPDSSSEDMISARKERHPGPPSLGNNVRNSRQADLTASPTKIKVLIVHGEELIRFGLRRLIDTSERFATCADTDDAPTARELFAQHQPKLVVLGLILRRGGGIQLTKDFRKLDATAATLILSAGEDPLSIQRAVRAGARGYLTTGDGIAEVVRALDEISAGHSCVGATVLPWLLQNFATSKIRGGDSELHILSDRELEIFALIGRGFGVSQLARELSVSVKTIDTHQVRMKEKLQLHSTAQLRQKAARWMLDSARKGLRRA